MWYLFIVVVLLYFSYYFDYKQKNRNKSLCYLFVLLLLVLTAGLRYRLGIDSIFYEEQFTNSIPSLLNITVLDFVNSAWDPLFLFLTSLVRTFTDRFWVFQLIQATIVNITILWFIKRNTTNVFFAVLLYFIFIYPIFMCEVLRESCAISMFLIGCEYLQRKKWIKCFLFLILASLFHNGALVFLFIPLLYWLKLDRFLKINSRLLVLLCFIFLVGFLLQPYIFNIFKLFALSQKLQDKIGVYELSSMGRGVSSVYGLVLIFISKLLYPYISIYLLKRQKNTVINYIEPLVCLSLIITVLSFHVNIMYRLNNYFILFIFIGISELVFSRIIRIGRYKIFLKGYFIWLFLLVPYFSSRMISLFGSFQETQFKTYMLYYPYNSVLDMQKNNDREQIYYYYY